LGETTIHSERFGTRHRAALGATEQTDAIVVVVSEENGQVSLVQRARIVRNLSEAQLTRSLRSLLEPNVDRAGGRTPRLADIGRAVRASRRENGSPAEPMPPSEPMTTAAAAAGGPSTPSTAPAVAAGPADPERVAGPDDAAAEATAEMPVARLADPVSDAGAAPAIDGTAPTPGRKDREPAGTRGRNR